MMLFERQRLLLTFLDVIGQPVGHTDFQKLLFLYSQECEVVPSYEFVPYKFGAFSFTSYADKRKLIAEGMLAGDDHQWILTDLGREVAQERPVEPMRVSKFCQKYSHLRGNALIVEQYRKYPFHATRSEILDKLRLEPASVARIAASRPKHQAAGLVTIGYEGRTLEGYLNELIRSGVTLLCDVRRNPLSRKYGFSKSTLSKACEGVGIRYEHLPELGVASDERQELNQQADYDALFERYSRTTLPNQKQTLELILGWIAAGEKVALTCYERHPEQCHRHCVSEALGALSGTTRATQHL